MKIKSLSICLTFLLVGSVLLAAGCSQKYPDSVIPLDDDNFDNVVLENDGPVIVFFYWSDNSSKYEPILSMINKYSAMMADEVVFTKYCMENGEVDEEYGIKNDLVCIRVEGGTVVDQKGLPEYTKDSPINSGIMALLLEDYMASYLNFSFQDYYPENIDGENFEEKVMNSDMPVLVQLTLENTTCNIVKSCADNFAGAAQKYGDLSDFYFLDAEDSGGLEIMQKYNIRKIPTIISFYKGKQFLKFDRPLKNPYYSAQIFGMIFQHIEI